MALTDALAIVGIALALLVAWALYRTSRRP
jgi:hypothetical protein